MQPHPPSPAPPTIPGLGDPVDGALLRTMRRALQDCCSLMEEMASGRPRPASDGVSFGGSAPRSAVAVLERCGLLPIHAVAEMSASIGASQLPFGTAVSVAVLSAEGLIWGRLAPVLPSCGPVEAALMPGLASRASVLVAWVAGAEAARAATAVLASGSGSRRRPPGAASGEVDAILRRWRRESEDADRAAAIAAYRAASTAARAAANLVALRMRRASSPRPRRRPRAAKAVPPAP